MQHNDDWEINKYMFLMIIFDIHIWTWFYYKQIVQ